MRLDENFGQISEKRLSFKGKILKRCPHDLNTTHYHAGSRNILHTAWKVFRVSENYKIEGIKLLNRDNFALKKKCIRMDMAQINI